MLSHILRFARNSIPLLDTHNTACPKLKISVRQCISTNRQCKVEQPDDTCMVSLKPQIAQTSQKCCNADHMDSSTLGVTCVYECGLCTAAGASTVAYKADCIKTHITQWQVFRCHSCHHLKPKLIFELVMVF